MQLTQFLKRLLGGKPAAHPVSVLPQKQHATAQSKLAQYANTDPYDLPAPRVANHAHRVLHSHGHSHAHGHTHSHKTAPAAKHAPPETLKKEEE